MWAAWIVGALAAWIMALAPSLFVFVAGMLIYSMTSFVVAPLNSYVAASSGKWSVGRTLTLVSAFFNAGAILGPLLSGMIGQNYGYRGIFLFAASFFIVSTAVIFFIRPQPTEAPRQGEKGDHLFRNQRFLLFLSAYFIATFAMYLPQPLAPNFLQNQHHLGLSQIGRLYSINGLGIVTLNLVLGQFSSRLGFLVGQAAVAAFAWILWQGSGLPIYSLAFFLLGGFRAAHSLAIAHIRSVVSGANMGLAFGVGETVSAFAMFFAPPLAGYLYQLQPDRVYSVGLGAIVISLVTCLFLTSGNLVSRTLKEKIPRRETI
jgi:predicted MFS family arabinose efflux permease